MNNDTKTPVNRQTFVVLPEPTHTDAPVEVQILEQMTMLYADASHFTQHCFARNAEGKMVGSSDRSAASWCINGGFTIIADTYGFATAQRWRIARARHILSDACIQVATRNGWDASNDASYYVNDTLGYPFVVEACKLALEIAMKKWDEGILRD